MRHILTLGTALFTIAVAQAKADGLYLYGDLAAQIYSDQEEDGVEFSFEPGGSIGGGVGYEFGPFSVDLLLEVGTADFDEIEGDDADGELSWFAIVPNFYYNWRHYSKFTPRVGLGVGYIDTDSELVETDDFFYLLDGENYVLYQASAG